MEIPLLKGKCSFYLAPVLIYRKTHENGSRKILRLSCCTLCSLKKENGVKDIYPLVKTVKIQWSLDRGNTHPLRAKQGRRAQWAALIKTPAHSSVLTLALHSCSSLPSRTPEATCSSPQPTLGTLSFRGGDTPEPSVPTVPWQPRAPRQAPPCPWWHCDIGSCILDATGDGCPLPARQIGSGMWGMIDTTCKFLFCQSLATLWVVKPNHPAVALPQSYMMLDVYQAFQLPTTLTNSSLMYLLHSLKSCRLRKVYLLHRGCCKKMVWLAGLRGEEAHLNWRAF